MEQTTAAMSDRLSGLRGKSVTVVSVGLSGLLAQVHLAPEDRAEGEHAMAKGQLMVRGKWLLPPYRGATQRTHDSGVTTNTPTQRNDYEQHKVVPTSACA